MIRRACTNAARTCVAYHFEMYQTLVAVIGLIAVIHILFEFAWPRAIGYGIITVAAYWVGQGIVALLQRPARRHSSLD
jgi:hypothetical protein